jgi:hypothetical protein
MTKGGVMRKILTAVVAVVAVVGLWLIAWPAFGPYIRPHFDFPLAGNNEITALAVMPEADGRWTARVDYFFTGKPQAVDVTIIISGATTPATKAPQQAQPSRNAVRGANFTNLKIERPMVPEPLATTQVTAVLMNRLTHQELARRSVEAKIEWPDLVQWEVNELLTSMPRDALLQKALSLMQAGDTRSLVQAKRILSGLTSKYRDYTEPQQHLVKLLASASWGPNGYQRLNYGGAIKREVNQLMNEYAFQELDEMAVNLREAKATNDSGYPLLAYFHSAVHGDFYAQEKLKPEALQALETTDDPPVFIGTWLAGNRCSPTARMWLADAYYKAAWQVRGGGTANTVSQEQSLRYTALLKKSAKVLMDCKAYGAGDPQWYAELLETLRLLPVDRENLAQVFVEGFGKFPNYPPIQTAMAWSMAPKWGGSAEQLEAFVREVASKFPTSEADAAYASLYNNMLAQGWPSMQPGIAGLKLSCQRWLKG